MAELGPFAPDRRVVVGVSGGADSMALAWLLRGWGAPLAVVVDHGLRAESGAEAALTLSRLDAMGVPGRIVRLTGLAAGPGLGARARDARYAALLGVCAAEGLPDLLIAHHMQDQAETVALRARAGSGATGLAAMAVVAWRDEARILRPLLAVPPGRLRATLRDAGVAWVEDPTNHDPATARGGLRASGLEAELLVADAAREGAARRRAELALAEELARRVRILPGGYAEVTGGLSAAAWSALVWTVSGRAYPPPVTAVERLAAAGRGTLHGVEVCASSGRDEPTPGPSLTQGGGKPRGALVVREGAAMGPGVPAIPSAVWDGRFLLADAVPGAVLGAWGDAKRPRHPPFVARRAMPALRVDGKLLPDPCAPYRDGQSWPRLRFRPVRPLAGAPFGARTVALGQ